MLYIVLKNDIYLYRIKESSPTMTIRFDRLKQRTWILKM